MGGDEVGVVHELVIADGTRRATINNTGSIAVTEVIADDATVDPDEYETQDNILIFDDARPDGEELNVTYNLSRYDATRMMSELEDAARTVGGDLRVPWRVPDGSGIIDDTKDDMIDPSNGIIDAEVETLIVVRCGLQIVNAKSGNAADDSISIRDGDTAIDTSKGATASSGRMRTLQDEYDKRLKTLLTRRFLGDVSA